MVQHQGIDVYLAPFHDTGKRYREHAAPVNSPVFSGDPNDVWVEAVNGQRFVIIVDLLKDFDRKGSQALHIARGIGSNIEITDSQTYAQLNRKVPAGANLQGRDYCKTEDRKFNGRWATCGFAFAQLEMDEEMDMDQAQVQTAVDVLGKITVSVQRGELKELPARSPRTLWDGYDPPDTEVSSKAVVKDNHVSHSIRHVVLGESRQPTTGRSKAWRSLSGAGGKTINFTIHYRSRDVLQRLKIVPKDKMHIDLTKSPPPSPRIKRETRDGVIKREDTEDQRPIREIKREPTTGRASGGAGAPPVNTTPADNPDDTGTSDEQINKKRKAMEDELREVELEQKRLRLTKALTEIKGKGK